MRGDHTGRGWEGFVCELREVFLERNPRALAATWRKGMRTPGARAIVWAAERAFPVAQTLEVAAELEDRIRSDGLGEASRWLLSTLFPGWRAEIPRQTADVLASGPVLIYGNHLSFLTPFLVAATVPRGDLKMISDSIVDYLLPSFKEYGLPVFLPRRGLVDTFLSGGLVRVVVESVVARVKAAPSAEEAKESNRRSLDRATEHIRSGGAVLIAPGGMSYWNRRWFPGIGRIVLALARDRSESFLVPFREERSSNQRVGAVLSRGLVARAKRGVIYRRPVGIRYGDPVGVGCLGPLPSSPAAVSRLLQERYRRAFGS